MIPEIQPPELYERANLPTQTYHINLDKGRISGMVDGLDALRQHIYKVLMTSRWEHVIYSASFGSEHSAIGRSNTLLLQSEIVRTITEALIYDERISRVYDFDFSQDGDELLVRFWVDSAAGSLAMEVTT